MRCIPKYRVGYNGEFYEAGREFKIDPKDADEMRRHGTVLDDPTPLATEVAEPKKPGRPRRTANVVHDGQPVKAQAQNRRS